MGTSNLIAKLVKDLRPVKQLPSAGCCSSSWFMVAFSFVALSVFLLGGLRYDLLKVIHYPGFQLVNSFILLSGLLAAYAAFDLRIPRTRPGLKIKFLLLSATLIWIGLFSYFLQEVDWREVGAHFTVEHYIHHCLIDFSLIMAVPVFSIFYMLKKGASTHPFWSGYAAFLAAASFAAIGMRFLCPLDDTAHLLVWHFLPVVIFVVIGSLIGKYLLRW